MPESSLYAGERDGARVFRVGRVGFDEGSADLGSHVYRGTYRTERFAPAGNGALINFRRVAIHLLTSGNYRFLVKVWVDESRTTLGGTAVQATVFNNSGGALREVTHEVALEADGSHIQVEIIVDSDDVDGVFLIEGIMARGRIARRSATRTAETT